MTLTPQSCKRVSPHLKKSDFTKLPVGCRTDTERLHSNSGPSSYEATVRVPYPLMQFKITANLEGIPAVILQAAENTPERSVSVIYTCSFAIFLH